MECNLISSEFKFPEEKDFLYESVKYLEICERHCRCSDAWHFIWSLLKVSGFRRAIYHQQPLIKRIIQKHIKSDARVLIAGAADTGLLHVLRTSQPGNSYDCSVVDSCGAPLYSNSLYAESHAIQVSTIQKNLIDLETDDQWDLIVAHTTLVMSGSDSRKKILRNFNKWLSLSGIVVFHMRYLVNNVDMSSEFFRTESANLKSLASTVYKDHPHLVSLLHSRIDLYVDNSFRSVSERPSRVQFHEELQECGFRLSEVHELDTVAGTFTHRMNESNLIVSEIIVASKNVP